MCADYGKTIFNRACLVSFNGNVIDIQIRARHRRSFRSSSLASLALSTTLRLPHNAESWLGGMGSFVGRVAMGIRIDRPLSLFARHILKQASHLHRYSSIAANFTART
jgi:hypothetical protein